MAFDVVEDAFSTGDNSVPSQLFPDQPAMALPESSAIRTRQLEFARGGGQWTINGQTWDDVVRSGFSRTLADPFRDDVEIWELRNSSGGWHHPVHIHFIDFKILSRNGNPPLPHERGAKDVVFLGENETVRVLIKFDHGSGKYMIHCHNLVHEDHDMMGQFEIRDAVTADEPFADPCSSDSEPDL
jgi:FtsP/CotA-like multicopper oxidase with cupredoxin domain